MPRRNSKKTRYDGMTQRQQRRVDRKYTRRNDALNWTDKLLEKLKENNSDENQMEVVKL